ncbi:tetratricopeptide repeat protein [bacterium]|nr:tetratricopeptide repeat protein [bacterium]MBU1072590.1 tetratricopeptide repeat protein [bacterium]MBU1675405.1 tetratricopeptide repeat protein [bacterium]
MPNHEETTSDRALPPAAAQQRFDAGRRSERDADLDGALAAYRDALALSPGKADWCYRLGCVHRKLGCYREAAAAFRQAIEQGGESGPYLNNLGTVLDALGERAEAMQMFHRAIAADGDNAEACHNLGALYAEEGRTRDAIRFFEAALELRPDADGYHNLGLVHFQAAQFDKALECFEKCEKLAPEHAVTKYFAALSLLRKGVYREAVARFSAALALDNRLVRAHFYVGVAMHKMGRLEDALAALLRALEAFPDDGKLHYQLALTYDALVMPMEAREHYRLARREA